MASRLLVDIFVQVLGVLTMWVFKGPKQILEGPFLE